MLSDTLNYQMIDIYGENITIIDVANGIEDVSSGTIIANENIVEWSIAEEPTMTGTYEIIEPSIDLPETVNLFFILPDNMNEMLTDIIDENTAALITNIYDGTSEIIIGRSEREVGYQVKDE